MDAFRIRPARIARASACGRTGARRGCSGVGPGCDLCNRGRGTWPRRGIQARSHPHVTVPRKRSRACCASRGRKARRDASRAAGTAHDASAEGAAAALPRARGGAVRPLQSGRQEGSGAGARSSFPRRGSRTWRTASPAPGNARRAAEELRGLIDDYIRDEVFYREGRALGLDRDDIVIRRRLRQKMEFMPRTWASRSRATSSSRRISRRTPSSSGARIV